MKTIFTFLLVTALTLGVRAQLAVDFETATTAYWEVFGNGSGSTSDFGKIANPYKTGINASDSVLKFIVNPDAETWVGAWTDFYSPILFTANSHTVTMMVYKSVVSNCALKLEGDGLSAIEVKVPNTLINQWEILTFDFAAAVGLTYNRLVIFPDFPDTRTEGSVNYIDNIATTGATSVNERAIASIKVYPNPADEFLNVEHQGMTSLTISGLLGKTIKTFTFQPSDSRMVNVNDLKTGAYIISIQTAKGTFATKFMKR